MAIHNADHSDDWPQSQRSNTRGDSPSVFADPIWLVGRDTTEARRLLLWGSADCVGAGVRTGMSLLLSVTVADRPNGCTGLSSIRSRTTAGTGGGFLFVVPTNLSRRRLDTLLSKRAKIYTFYRPQKATLPNSPGANPTTKPRRCGGRLSMLRMSPCWNRSRHPARNTLR